MYLHYKVLDLSPSQVSLSYICSSFCRPPPVQTAEIAPKKEREREREMDRWMVKICILCALVLNCL